MTPLCTTCMQLICVSLICQVEGGGSEAQQVLDGMTVGLAIIHWHATWSHTSVATVEKISALANENRNVGFLRIDILATPDNKAFAMEKVSNLGEYWSMGMVDCKHWRAQAWVLISIMWLVTAPLHDLTLVSFKPSRRHAIAFVALQIAVLT